MPTEKNGACSRMGILCLLASVTLNAQTAPQILEKNCAGCHGVSRMSGLDLRTREGTLKGGTRGAALDPGNPGGSLLLKAVAKTGDLQMPPGKKSISAQEVEVIRKWIEDGAPWQEANNQAEPSWWSFKKLKPAESKSIDAFVNAKLSEKGLRPLLKADKRTLIRRLYFDLHGLPAPSEEIEQFVNDKDPEAWPKLVDRLLASPRYGERWGRHWLDVVRYADTGGFETDIYFPNAWRYRDYVISSLNEDKPYNRFVQEQIAGDELWPDNLDLTGGFEPSKEKLDHLAAKIATGVYTIGPVYHEAALQGDQIRYEWLTDVVDTTGDAFLGVSLGCSRCHDHKFDPITRRDYHAMMAVFAASEEREVPAVTQFSIFGFKSGYPGYLRVEDLKEAIHKIEKTARQRVVDRVRARFSKDILDAHAIPSAKRTPEQTALAAQLEKAMTEAGLQENAQGKEPDISYTAAETAERERLIHELGQASLKANPVLQTATVLGHAEPVPDVHLTSRGDWRVKGDKIGPAVPAVIASGVTIDENPLTRRKALAVWLTQSDHPLTARVFVNRVWHWHFGRGLVGTPNDFGRQGEEPTHPELLDSLAAGFVADGWSIKKLHRKILLSDTYQRSSGPDELNATTDATNRYLWRFNRQRLDSETLRDSVLAVSGTLNLKMGGRPAIPPLTKEESAGLWAKSQWPESLDPAEHVRRSVYLYVKRSFPYPMFSTFDSPDPSQSCSRRDSTTVAPQALTLMNSEFMSAQSRQLAARAEKQPDPVNTLWRITLGRSPSAGELTKAKLFLADSSLDKLALVVLNMNEFLYVD